MTSEQLLVFLRDYHLPVLPGTFLPTAQADGWFSAAPCFLPDSSGGILLVREKKLYVGDHRDADMSNVWTRASEIFNRLSGVIQLPQSGFHEALPSQTGHIASYQ